MPVSFVEWRGKSVGWGCFGPPSVESRIAASCGVGITKTIGRQTWIPITNVVRSSVWQAVYVYGEESISELCRIGR